MSIEHLGPEQQQVPNIEVLEPARTEPSITETATPQSPATRSPVREFGHPVKVHSDKKPGQEAPGARLSPESSKSLQEALADIRRAQRVGSATANHAYINTRNHRT